MRKREVASASSVSSKAMLGRTAYEPRVLANGGLVASNR